jgi:hypothetical protein
MKNVLLAILFVLSSCGTQNAKNEADRSLSSVNNVESKDYCISIRGNGQRIAALWGALARIIESYGAPAGMGGGSSSTYSMFLVESILMNPHLRASEGPEQYKEQVAFLVKSLMGYINYIQTTPLFEKALALADDPNTMKEVDALMKEMEKAKDARALGKVFGKFRLAFQYISSGRTRKIAYIFGHSDVKMIMNKELFEEFLAAKKETEALSSLIDNPKVSDQTKKEAVRTHEKLLAFRKQEFNLSLKNFGNYDVNQNPNLFFRPGPIDFIGFSQLFNRAANFYAGYGYNDNITKKFKKFINKCSVNSLGKKWDEIVKKNSSCQDSFENLVKLHHEEQEAHEKGFKYEIAHATISKQSVGQRKKKAFSFPQRIDDLIGKKVSSMPVTGILLGDSAKRYKEMQKAYYKTTSPRFGDDYVANEKDLRIGYWGTSEQLAKIQDGLKASISDGLGREFDFGNDYKSSLFYPLYQAKWREVFMASPVEPGLSNIQQVSRTDVLSIGGWMDHLSAPALKASGCPRVVTITKGDGAGNFESSMIKRVIGLETPTWEEIPVFSRSGNPEDKESIWGRYSNVANPESSFNTSLNAADAVVCTNYDMVNFKDGLKAFFDNGYDAPVVIHPSVKGDFLNRHNFINEISEKNRFNKNPPYISCYPLEYK